MIHLEGVTKVFVTDEVETHALAGIHLDIKKGEYLSIAGPSGCGKSTLLAILGLLDSPSDGTYILNGKPVQGLKLSERARIRNREIGFIFQAFNLIGDLTVYENVELPLTYRGMPSAERKKRVHEALERVGMSHRVKHYPSQLSGGQQQRVAVARALGGDPSILLADEPTGNLDSANGEAVMDLLARTASRRRDDLHGDARSSLCALRRPQHSFVRRPRGGRVDGNRLAICGSATPRGGESHSGGSIHFGLNLRQIAAGCPGPGALPTLKLRVESHVEYPESVREPHENVPSTLPPSIFRFDDYRGSVDFRRFRPTRNREGSRSRQRPAATGSFHYVTRDRHAGKDGH